MKIKILFMVFFTMITSQTLAKVALDPDLSIDLITKETDDREKLHKLNFDKLLKNAEKYYRDAKSWKKIRCEPKSGFICTKHSCKKRAATHAVILDKKAETVTRCEGKDCETFSAKFDQTGVFVNISAKGPIGTLIRILGDYRYKEITTIGLDAYIANGECLVVTD